MVKRHQIDYSIGAFRRNDGSAAEATLFPKPYFTKVGCGREVANTMQVAWIASVQTAYAATIARHDATGRHAWGGPNQRP